jgi:hypothetical protein
LFVANDSTPNYLYRNQSPIISDEAKPLYRNEGDFQFKEVGATSGMNSDTPPLLSWSVSQADFDNDGWLDLLTVYGHVYPQVDSLAHSAGYRAPMALVLNQRDGSFCNATGLAGPAISSTSAARGLAMGDLFNDGNLDGVVGNIDGSSMILRNCGVAGNHWIGFILAGKIQIAPRSEQSSR